MILSLKYPLEQRTFIGLVN
uniref:Uncharacterized protein n=1 Tax=Anguilla anguilla TaxID=7936 RepID=A0A0E9PK18_ANGAN